MSMEGSKEGFIPNYKPVKIKLPVNKEKKIYYQMMAGLHPVIHFSEGAKINSSTINDRKIDTSLFLKNFQSKRLKGISSHGGNGKAQNSIIPKTFNWEDYQWIKDPGEVKKKYDIWPLDPLVLFVGEFNQNYGLDILLNAIPALIKNYPNLRFILVGNGELMWPLRLNARYLFFEHAIRLVGHKEGKDLQELFQAADMVLIPNKISISPYQVLAGWSSKKPVIATEAGGCNLIKHEENGISIHDYPDSIIWGIERILSDWNKAHEIAQRGWEEIQKNYS